LTLNDKTLSRFALLIKQRNEGLRKFEVDIGQLVSNEEIEEKARKEKAQHIKEANENRVKFIIQIHNLNKFMFN
jgi:hypothetical protein